MYFIITIGYLNLNLAELKINYKVLLFNFKIFSIIRLVGI